MLSSRFTIVTNALSIATNINDVTKIIYIIIEEHGIMLCRSEVINSASNRNEDEKDFPGIHKIYS